MWHRISVGVLAVVASASLAQAQTVPGPRVNLGIDRPTAPTCESTTPTSAWEHTYGTCYRPTGVNLGDPYLTHVRVTFTGATTVSSLVPRAQVTVETTAGRCGTGTAPCLRISDLAAPAGPTQVTVRFVDGEGREGAASTAIPFTGTAPAVPPATGLRAIP
jgi:hypothetical protein